MKNLSSLIHKTKRGIRPFLLHGDFEGQFGLVLHVLVKATALPEEDIRRHQLAVRGQDLGIYVLIRNWAKQFLSTKHYFPA